VTPLRLLPFFVLAACAVEVEPDPDFETEEAAIHGDDYSATSWMIASAGAVRFPPGTPETPWCSATRIGPRHMLTSSWCYAITDTIEFYSDASASDPALRRRVIAVKALTPEIPQPKNRPLILVLDADVPWGAAATLAWRYPGENSYVRKVGNGDHGGVSNDEAELRYATDRTTNEHNAAVLGVLQDEVDPGDEGGPMYYGRKLLGVALDTSDDECQAGPACYASVPYHLSWILTQIGWTWPHGTAQLSTYRAGTTIEVVPQTTERICQYACEHTASCVAYDYNTVTDDCVTLSSVTATYTGLSFQAWRSDLR
jgi:hypothetical protein